MYVLGSGCIEAYVSLSEEDLTLQLLTSPGTVMGQYTVLDKKTITYSARATTETHLLFLERERM